MLPHSLIYVAVRQAICACSIVHLGNEKLRGPVVRNVGGVKFQPLSFLKHSNHLKRTLKMFLNGTVRFGYCLTYNLLYGATTMAEVSLHSTFTRSTVSFGYV